MYILQLCDINTYEIIQQQYHFKVDFIEKMIYSFRKSYKVNTFIFDKQFLKADLVIYKVYPEGNDVVYKLFFNLQLANKKSKYKYVNE